MTTTRHETVTWTISCDHIDCDAVVTVPATDDALVDWGEMVVMARPSTDGRTHCHVTHHYCPSHADDIANFLTEAHTLKEPTLL